ncbi:TetR/AcrR family transcriptional regulator [Chitinivorax sp. PXF-14]|uniref:TetR/AcrR family transcriptional regulator n=1 Tax=Chitinivorax sp. PXF-14 TaxID=3230488 RepID=UPI003466F3BC
MPAQLSSLLLGVLRTLAAERSLDQIGYGDVAAGAGVPWQTVRRVLGPRESFAALLADSGDGGFDTRSKILAAAGKVFAQKGYGGASLDAVAAEAGLTKGAIYWNFSSKADLFFALLDVRFKRSVDSLPLLMQAAVAAEDKKQGLTQLVENVWQEGTVDPDWPQLFLEFMTQARDPETRERLARVYREGYAVSEKATAILKKTGQTAPELDGKVVAVFWSALLDGLMLANLVDPEGLDIGNLLPKLIDVVWHGLAPDAQRKSVQASHEDANKKSKTA